MTPNKQQISLRNQPGVASLNSARQNATIRIKKRAMARTLSARTISEFF